MIPTAPPAKKPNCQVRTREHLLPQEVEAIPVHPHMLRHACGFYLASKGQDTRAIQAYLGYKNI